MSSRLKVTLTFPDREMPDQRYTMPRSLLVTELKRKLAGLLQTQLPILLFVGPTWVPLDHSGCVTDRAFLGTDSPCPFLEDGSVIRVETGENWTSVGEDVILRDELSQLPRVDESEPESGFDESNLVTDGGLHTVARGIALYDANTWVQKRFIDRRNATPQAALGGESPHDLVYGSGEISSELRFGGRLGGLPRREQQGSSSSASFSDTQREERGLADDHPPKRIRLEDLSAATPEQAPPLSDQSDSQRSSSVELFSGQNARVSRVE
jgi:hypothetical protein